MFYKILMDNLAGSRGKKKNIRAINFQYLEPNDNNIFEVQPVIVTPEHEEVVKQQMMDIWQKIQAHEFYKGCGKEDCHWCNFVRENKLSLLQAIET